jgi:hypothetical protein
LRSGSIQAKFYPQYFTVGRSHIRHTETNGQFPFPAAALAGRGRTPAFVFIFRNAQI